MMIIPCPSCGPRNVSEFRYVDEARCARPDPNTVTPEEWRTYLYFRDNTCGWTEETWYHRAGCRRYFKIERNTLSNEVRRNGPDEPAEGQELALIGRNSESAGVGGVE